MGNAPHLCAHCRRRDQIQHQTDVMLCLACGGLTDYHGNALPGEPQFGVRSTQPEFVKDGDHGEGTPGIQGGAGEDRLEAGDLAEASGGDPGGLEPAGVASGQEGQSAPQEGEG